MLLADILKMVEACIAFQTGVDVVADTNVISNLKMFVKLICR